MSPLEAVALIGLLLLPFDLLVRRQLAKLDDPADLLEHGVVIVHERALDAHSRSIGSYAGHDIWETVTFRGLVYRFERLQPPRRREKLAPGELFLDPGLIYKLS